jgi:hypothetical protein
MRLPGRAWLQFEVEPDGNGSTIRQTAEFDPVGLAGRLYWYGLYALHELVFAGMLRGIAGEARRRAASGKGRGGDSLGFGGTHPARPPSPWRPDQSS